jgi:hypothetical protein
VNRPGLHEQPLKSIPDPGAPSLREMVERLLGNIAEAARLEAAALAEFKALDLGDKKEKAALGWVVQAHSEKLHWMDYRAVYRQWLETHPELADAPVGARCSHGPACTIGHPLRSLQRQPVAEREPGGDDGPDYTDRRLPPEKDLDLPFAT